MDSNASQPTDILLELRSQCPPELIEHIFSFTTSRHASAAAFFRVATERSLFQDNLVIHTRLTSKNAKQSHLEFAFVTGDLPLLKWMLTQSPEKYHDLNWNFLAITTHPFSIGDNNIHVYLYAFTLLDVSNPLLAETYARNCLLSLHAKLRTFATQHERIYLLELLQRSNFAVKDEATFFDSRMVITMRNMNLLEHARKHKLFNPKDELLHFALSTAWVNGLVYLFNTCGLRFPTWNFKDYLFLTPSNVAAMALHDLQIFPDDICLRCFKRWFPRIGYWGMIAVYKYHNLHAQCLQDDDKSAINVWRSNVPLLQYAMDDAVLKRDLIKIEYMSLHMLFIEPTLDAIKSIAQKNDAELLKFLFAKFSGVQLQIHKKYVQQTLEAYMNDKSVEYASFQPMLQFFDSIPATKDKFITRHHINKAVIKQDIGLVKWMLGHSSHRFNERDVNNWKRLAKADGCEEMEKILNEYHDNFKTSHPKEEDMAVVAMFV